MFVASYLVAVAAIAQVFPSLVASTPLEPRAVVYNPNLSFTRTASQPETQPLAKRLTFTTGGRDDYCGETNPTFTYGDSTPLAADCAAIGQSLAGITGFWTVDASDFKPPDRWATIATSGTCQFALQFQLPSSIQSMFIGTNDLRFYINSYVGNSQNGHIQAIGTAACNNNTGGVLLLMNWGMLHS